jgi:hypothetical protein
MLAYCEGCVKSLFFHEVHEEEPKPHEDFIG